MPLHVDMTGVKESLAALPPGNYPARVDNVEVGEARTSGQPVLNIHYTVTGGPHAGRKVFQTISLQQTALWKLYQTLEAFGYSEADLSGELELDEQELINMECTLVMVQRPWKDEMRHRVARVLPAGAGDVSPATPLAGEPATDALF